MTVDAVLVAFATFTGMVLGGGFGILFAMLRADLQADPVRPFPHFVGGIIGGGLAACLFTALVLL